MIFLFIKIITFFRPALKGMVRQGNNFLQVCKQIGALTKVDNPEGDVTVLREAMGVLQVIYFCFAT